MKECKMCEYYEKTDDEQPCKRCLANILEFGQPSSFTPKFHKLNDSEQITAGAIRQTRGDES